VRARLHTPVGKRASVNVEGTINTMESILEIADQTDTTINR
jgi:hypothetical protein